MTVFVIDDPARPARRTRCESDLPPAEYASDWGAPSQRGMRRATWVGHDGKERRRPLTEGEVACTLGHEAVWQRVAAGPDPWALVLEDDAVLLNPWENQLAYAQRVEQWDLIYLGRLLSRADEPLRRGIVRAGLSLGTHAYALTREAATKLITGDIRSGMVPLGYWLSGFHAPEPWARGAARLTAIALTPDKARQYDVSDSGTLHSPVWRPRG